MLARDNNAPAIVRYALSHGANIAANCRAVKPDRQNAVNLAGKNDGSPARHGRARRPGRSEAWKGRLAEFGLKPGARRDRTGGCLRVGRDPGPNLKAGRACDHGQSGRPPRQVHPPRRRETAANSERGPSLPFQHVGRWCWKGCAGDAHFMGGAKRHNLRWHRKGLGIVKKSAPVRFSAHPPGAMSFSG